MVFSRGMRAVAAWLGQLLGLRQQHWVEPSNAITRAVLSGAEFVLPELPKAQPTVWDGDTREVTAPAVADAVPGEASVPEAGKAPSGDQAPDDGRWRAA